MPNDFYLSGIADDSQQLVALFVYEQLALRALEALPAQPPDPVAAIGAVGLAVEPLGLEDVPVDLVELPPPPGAPPVDGPVLALAGHARRRGDAGEDVDAQLGLLVDLVEPDGLFQLHLAGERAGVALLVHPLDGEGVVAVEAAHLPHLALQLRVGDAVVDVRDEDVPVEGRLHADLGDLALVELVGRRPREVVGAVREGHLGAQGHQGEDDAAASPAGSRKKELIPLFLAAEWSGGGALLFCHLSVFFSQVAVTNSLSRKAEQIR